MTNMLNELLKEKGQKELRLSWFYFEQQQQVPSVSPIIFYLHGPRGTVHHTVHV